jgi:hypothetical protein
MEKPICGDILPCPSSLNVAVTAQNGHKSCEYEEYIENLYKFK